jgi:hypothetical protein
LHHANPEKVEQLAAAASELAEKWGVGDQEIVADDVEDVEGIDEALVDVD